MCWQVNDKFCEVCEAADTGCQGEGEKEVAVQSG